MRLILAASAAVVVSAAMVPGARAQFCNTPYCSRYESGECVQYSQLVCTNTNHAGPTYSYGAIAYGRTSRAYGFSYSWGTQQKAEDVAMKNCSQHGSDCEVMVWFDRRCGAVAQGNGTSAFWGLGTAAGAANADALGKCSKSGTKGCAVQVSKCSR